MIKMPKKISKDEIESAISKASESEEKLASNPSNKDNESKEQEKIKELTDTLQRVQAEFINYKNRAEREKITCIDYGNAELIKRLLPILDSFELALKNSQDALKFKKGMEMIYNQLFAVLNEEGLRKIDALNKKFDPYMHDVLMKEHSDKEEDTIIEEFQKGYMLKDKILRHTKVKISAGKAPAKVAEEIKNQESDNEKKEE